jgi:hypothetical protein
VEKNIGIYNKFEVDNIIEGDYKQENYDARVHERNSLLLRQVATFKGKASVLLWVRIW